MNVGDGEFLPAEVARPSLAREPFTGALEQGGGAVGEGGEADARQVAAVAVERDQGERPGGWMMVQPVGLLPVGLAGDVEEEAM